MFRIDHPTRAAALPSPDPLGSPGYFTKGDPTMAVPATRVTQDWLNAVQEELARAIEGQGLVLDKGNRAQLLQAMGRLAGGNVNGFLNPEFRIASGGATHPLGSTESPTTSGPDHWWGRAGGGGDVGALIPAAGGGSLLGSAVSPIRGAARFQKSTDATTGVAPTLRQSIESVASYAGQPIVVAFDARKFAGLDLPVLGCVVEQDFGSGGSSDTTTNLAAIGATTIDGTWRRFIFTGTLPSISGKTIGVAGDHLKVRISFGTNQLFDVHVSAFTMARGEVDAGYQPRELATDRRLCQRFREISILTASYGNFNRDMEAALWDTSFPAAGVVETLGRRFAVEKYANPTLTWYAHDGTANNITEGASTKHPVTSGTNPNGPTPTHTGYPTITSPPASGLRTFRAYFDALAEIPD